MSWLVWLFLPVVLSSYALWRYHRKNTSQLTLFQEHATKLNLRFENGKIIAPSGREFDIAEAIAALPWVDATKYRPVHQYCVDRQSPVTPWNVVKTLILKHPDSYDAYFRGYQKPMHYLDWTDGRRYWITSSWDFGGKTVMLNRATFDSAEPPRRVDQGAKPVDPDTWGAPPWEEKGAGWPSWYQPDPVTGKYVYRQELDPYRARRGKVGRG